MAAAVVVVVVVVVLVAVVVVVAVDAITILLLTDYYQAPLGPNATSDRCDDVLTTLGLLYTMPRHHVCYQLSPRSLEIAFEYLGTFLGVGAAAAASSASSASSASAFTAWQRPSRLSSLAAHCRASCGYCDEEQQGMEVAASPVARHAGRQAVNAGPPQGWARCEWLSGCGAPSQLLGSACAGTTRHGAAAAGYCYESTWGSLECGRRSALLILPYP